MENASKALLVIAILGLICGAAGYAGFAAGGPAGDFMRGALPGIIIGLSALLLIIRPRTDR